MTTITIQALNQLQGEGNFEDDTSTSILVTQGASGSPVPSFTATVPSTVTSTVMPLAVTFTDTSTNTPTAWLWTFGDGSTATTNTVTHTYLNAGVYTVTLTVTNASGTSEIVYHGLVVVSPTRQVTAAQTVLGTALATPSFTASATSGNHPVAITFTDTSTGSPTSWLWDFGDGGQSTAQNPVYTYSHAGTFGVTLSVENGGGRAISSPTTVVIS